MNKSEIQKARKIFESKNYDSTITHDAVLRLLKFSEENNLEKQRPPTFWNILLNSAFWLELMKLVYEILVILVTKKLKY